MSQLEEEFYLLLKAHKLPLSEREYRFDKKRKWRFDFAWPEKKLGVEIEGGIWQSGRHNRGKGFIQDCQKYNAAALQGWIVLRYTAETMGEAIEDLKKLGF